jgi:hypothetical protein
MQSHLRAGEAVRVLACNRTFVWCALMSGAYFAAARVLAEAAAHKRAVRAGALSTPHHNIKLVTALATKTLTCSFVPESCSLLNEILFL